MSVNRRVNRKYGNGRDMWRKRMAGCLIFAAKVTARAGFVVAVTFGALYLYEYATHHEYFAVDEISVDGEYYLSKKDVIYTSKISEGMNLLSINFSNARERLISHPWIADAEIVWTFPRKVRVEVREHKPLAIVDLERKFLLNRNGDVFKELERSDPKNLPIVDGLAVADLGPGETSRGAVFDSVLEILSLGSQPDSIIPNRVIKKIDVDREIGIALTTDSDFMPGKIKTIKLGYMDFSGKLERFKNILAHLKQMSTDSIIETIDLVDLDRIIVNRIVGESKGERLVDVDLADSPDSA